MKWKSLAMVLALIAINFGAKFIFLDDSSVNLDEAYSIYHSQQELAELSTIFEKEANPPTYFLILHYWIKWFGISQVAVRALSLLFSSFIIGLGYLLLRPKIKWFETILMAVALAFCESLFYYGIEARVHALTCFVGTCSILLLLKVYQSPHLNRLSVRGAAVILHALSLLALLYLHYANSILIALELMVLMTFMFRKSHLRYSWIYGVSALGIIPVIFWISADKIASTSSWLGSPSLENIWPMWVQLSNGSNWLAVVFIASILLAVFLIKGLTNKLIVSLPFLYIGLAYLISQYIPLFLERYLAFGAILIILCLGFTISQIRTTQVRWPVYLTLAILLAISFNPQTGKGEDWRGAVAHIKQTHPEADVLVSPVFMYRPYLYYADRTEFEKAGDIIKRCYAKRMYFVNQMGGEFFNYMRPAELIYISKNPDDANNLKRITEYYRLVDDKWFEGLHQYFFVLR